MKEASLINHNYEEVLDLLNKKFTSKKQIINTRHKIIELLYETFDINSKKLEQSFYFIKDNIPDEYKTYKTFPDINILINKYCYSIMQEDEFKDHGYTMLLIYFFWLTKDLEGGE